MKPGDLITLKEKPGPLPKSLIVTDFKPPVFGEVYTLKDLLERGHEYYIAIEEFSFGYVDGDKNNELMLSIDYWEKVITPPNIEEEIKESISIQVIEPIA